MVWWKINGVHQEAGRIMNSPTSQPKPNACVRLCSADTLLYQMSSGKYKSLSRCYPFALSFSLFIFSFPTHRLDEGRGRNAESEMMCPRFPEPLQLLHPIPSLKEALEKVRGVVRHAQNYNWCWISVMPTQVWGNVQADHRNPSHQMLLQLTEGD